ncbi:MBL fold metallo-hydrolase [Pendulispora rubella]|uniref:MBL fold metallo-hydrolase n=1 Tax=Pendulispora rubella TaxID=2741070 RepID=A0ABZ2L6H9_9BACT
MPHIIRTLSACAILLLGISCTDNPGLETRDSIAAPGEAGRPFPNAPEIAPIGVRIDKYLDLPDGAKGPGLDPKKGYRTEKLGRDLYMVTDNSYQSMFMVYETGVVVVDAPPTYATKLNEAIAEVTKLPITHIVYSHSHADHIGGTGSLDLSHNPVIVAHDETKMLLARDADPARPVPTVTFQNTYSLEVGSHVLKLSYHGNGHEPGNIFIDAPEQETLMVVDVVFPGWMPFRRLAVSQDIPGWLSQVEKIEKLPFKKLVTGHVTRLGTREDVKTQIEFDDDLKAVVGEALKSNAYVDGINPADMGNTWALVDDYTARVAVQCVTTLTRKWKSRLGGFDTFVWDNCYAMEQSLRVD